MFETLADFSADTTLLFTADEHVFDTEHLNHLWSRILFTRSSI